MKIKEINCHTNMLRNLASYPRQRAIVTKRVEFFMFVQIIHDVIQC